MENVTAEHIRAEVKRLIAEVTEREPEEITDTALFAEELLGPYAQLERGSFGAVENGRWLYRALRARGLTIAAGSSEIQHNIIGERVLKLPKG